jgi:hypothetical protein
MDEFSDIVDNIYKSFFSKFWGQDDFKELKNPARTVQKNMDVYDFLTDHGYTYDLLHRSYRDPRGNPVLNPEYVYLNLKNKNSVPWQDKYKQDEKS